MTGLLRKGPAYPAGRSIPLPAWYQEITTNGPAPVMAQIGGWLGAPGAFRNPWTVPSTAMEVTHPVTAPANTAMGNLPGMVAGTGGTIDTLVTTSDEYTLFCVVEISAGQIAAVSGTEQIFSRDGPAWGEAWLGINNNENLTFQIATGNLVQHQNVNLSAGAHVIMAQNRRVSSGNYEVTVWYDDAATYVVQEAEATTTSIGETWHVLSRYDAARQWSTGVAAALIFDGSAVTDYPTEMAAMFNAAKTWAGVS